MHIIQLTKHLGIAGKGRSQAQIFADASGKKYFVKYKENAQALQVLVNEYIAGKIAKTLELPYPDCFVVEIDSNIVSTLPPINGKKITARYHFATSQIENIYNYHNDLRELIKTCNNRLKYPFIILFDVLTQNCDRNNDGNFIITKKDKELHFNIIDHGHCFNYSWNAKTITSFIGKWNESGIAEMYNEISSELNCDDATNQIEIITDQFFDQIISELPSDWNLSQDEKKSLSHYLSSQKKEIRGLVTGQKSKLFKNWL